MARKAKINRKTKETSISVSVNLDGKGKYKIKTGIGFLDHMLEQLSKHSLIDLEVSAKGLLRLVGGKVTKKTPALIKTSSAVVGIRGGITIVQTEDERVDAAFIFGEEMTVTPNLNPDARTSITKEGFVVSVENSLTTACVPPTLIPPSLISSNPTRSKKSALRVTPPCACDTLNSSPTL